MAYSHTQYHALRTTDADRTEVAAAIDVDPPVGFVAVSEWEVFNRRDPDYTSFARTVVQAGGEPDVMWERLYEGDPDNSPPDGWMPAPDEDGAWFPYGEWDEGTAWRRKLVRIVGGE